MFSVSTVKQILAMTDIGVLLVDTSGVVLDANAVADELLGYAPHALIGMSVHAFLPPAFRAGHEQLVQRFVEETVVSRQMAARRDVMGCRKDGSVFPLEVALAKLQVTTDEMALVVTLRDITDRKQTEAELMRRSTHDLLTGLPNRTLLREKLSDALGDSVRTGVSVALLSVGLDGFKAVNDTYGHDAGDMLLRAVTAVLQAQTRPGDTVARLGGDEFVILCAQVEDPVAISALAERINDALREPIFVEQTPVYMTVSVGIAIGHGRTHHADDLLRFANTAMYVVKEKGRDGWKYFDQTLQEHAHQRAVVTQGLRLAIQRNELRACFQPIVSAATDRIVGAELLVRWHFMGRDVSPAVFIPIAEATGSILAIGEWVFRRGCEAEVEWRTRWGEAAPSYISINLSPRQLCDAHLTSVFAAIVRETGADPKRIVLEITETALMEDVENNLKVLRQLAQLGFRFAVDDFGTGYSSLAQLTRMPVSVLKIDKAFVDNIATDADSRAVIHAIVGLGRSLGLKMVAEGVENESQLIELRDHNCDYIQGYFFHRPLEADVFRSTVADSIANQHEHDYVQLFSLLYVSQACYPMDEQSISDILVVSRRKNRQLGITGCLLYQDGYFMQLLEGPRQHVLSLMDSIRADARHRNVVVVAEGHKLHRVFMDWSMGYQHVTEVVEEPAFFKPSVQPLGFVGLAQDALVCYTFITAFRPS